MSSFASSQLAIKLHNSVKGSPPRGGSGVTEIQGSIAMFGGADREQVHYQDLVAYEKHRSDGKSSFFDKVQSQGDTPMPRSGHGMVSYGKYTFVFGGIDFAEEIAFNDLYLLDSDTWEWSYVGESGVEVTARNSHSLTILSCNDVSFLVVYGGASPEHGPLSDVVYARLPPPSVIDPKSFFVEWKVLDRSDNAPHPGDREMHGSSSVLNTLIVTGGRNGKGEMLDDVWALSVQRKDGEEEEFEWKWQQWSAVSLPNVRCAHVSCFVSTVQSPTSILWKLCLFGGFTDCGVSGEVLSIELDYDLSVRAVLPASTASWLRNEFSGGPKARFGHALCPLSYQGLLDLWQNPRYKPLLQRGHAAETMSAIESALATRPGEQDEMLRVKLSAGSKCGAAFLFGGVSAEEDFADIWLLFL